MRLDVPTLKGNHIHLEPLGEEHQEELRRTADDARIWEFTRDRADGEEFDPWFERLSRGWYAGERVPFAVRRTSDRLLVGSTGYLDVQPRHRRVEIGGTWYHPSVWSAVVNPECKLLLLAYAFETLCLNRVAFATDALNVRSQAAITKLGAVREGVLRAHMVAQAGRIRDTVVFSITSAEWPAVRERLRDRILAFEWGA